LNERQLDVVHLGVQPYLETLELQRDLRLARLDGSLPHDTLLLVEHPPVYTLGRGTRTSSLPLPIEVLRAGGADVVEIERGGDVTWHGPGQLVGYPILNLSQHREDLHWYLRSLEQALIDALGILGIGAEREAGKTGVWVEGRKIASIGIHVKQWVTLHGFALNVDPDLKWFEAIVPCGITGVRMTSVARELGTACDQDQLADLARSAVVSSLCNTFTLTAHTLTAAELPDRLAMNAGSRRP
jgi:lipoyl(octanoyl) transferase